MRMQHGVDEQWGFHGVGPHLHLESNIAEETLVVVIFVCRHFCLLTSGVLE